MSTEIELLRRLTAAASAVVCEDDQLGWSPSTVSALAGALSAAMDFLVRHDAETAAWAAVAAKKEEKIHDLMVSLAEIIPDELLEETDEKEAAKGTP